jgi:hypothetical protein
VTATVAAAERPADSAVSDPPLVGPFAVALAEGAAAFMASCSLLLVTIGHTENVEFVVYLLAFCAALPLAFASALWLRSSLTRREVALLGVIDAGALAATLDVGRLADAGPRFFLVAGVGILALSELLAGQFRSVLALAAVRVGSLDWLLVPLLFAAAIAFLPSSAYNSKGFWLAFPVAGLLSLVAPEAMRRHRPLLVVDVVLLLLIAATVWDVFYWDGWMVDNHNYYLGPVNEVLHGRTVLVDVFAQYGVGVIYLLAGLFSLIPLGYGTFALVLSALTVVEFGLMYAIVRIAGRSQLIAVLASAVAIVYVIYGQIQSFVAYPSTGPLRFGLPYVVILLEVIGARSPARTRGLTLASAVVTALASLWSFETFAYTLAAFLAITALEAVVPERETRRQIVRRRVLPLVALVVALQIVFAVVTRAAAGGWPQWGTYLDYIRLYSVQGFYTLPVEAWSPGFLLAGVCFASALLLAFVAVRRPTLVRGREDLFVALAGSTAFAILAFTYFVGRSHPNNLHHIAPPAIMVCALWLCLLAEQRARLGPALGFALIGVAAWSAFMLVDRSRGELDAKWTHSALGTLVADGPSVLGDRVRFLARRPAIIPQAPEAVALLRAYDPHSSRSLVLLEPELTTEVLLRADRGNALPIATPPQDIVLPAAVRHVLAAVPRLRPGTIMLADPSYLAAAPGSDPNASLTELAAWRVQRFFRLRTLARSPSGLVVARLER